MDYMKGTLDRFEGDMALVEMEDGSIVNLLRLQLSKDIVEGDLIFLGVDGIWKRDTKATEARRQEMRSKLDSLFADDE